MMEPGFFNDIDQFPVYLKHTLVGALPQSLQPLASALLTITAILVIFPSLFAITTILERKGLGRIQNRYGPNRVGPFGFLQPAADGLKTLFKENIIPHGTDKVVYVLAPVLLIVSTFLLYSVLPIGRNMVALDLDAGILFFFAVGASTELAVFMAGWASRNKYSMLGAMRAIAQMISYELPLVLSTLVVIMMAGSLSLVSIVQQQAVYTAGIAHWNLFTPWGLAGFLLFLVAATAESNRSPFDLPEGESEIIAGYYLEYSGFKFALFFLGEYLGLFAVSGMAITLFLGGWSAPFEFLTFVPTYAWFFIKLLALICFFIWIRGTLPRLRMDQLMGFAWKFMLPMCLVNFIVAIVWRFMDPGVWRALVCFTLIVIPYIALARAMAGKREFRKRTYELAT
ncbi:MAG TPA: NADH-quinone oxidoreductase subunit NuoH [Verrucomicrobiae bacterium]|nr:NADH-quinone oxidoreductase subunit NuoH [Verrucomicrobiae bacterium]